jgi:Uma2 family endonuclease
MGHAAAAEQFTPQAYLDWEAAQTVRHEFVDGEVFALASAEDRHFTAAGNLFVALRQHLQGTPCRVYMSDVKLHVAAANSYFYPDLMVTCSAADAAQRLVKSEPNLVVEVLSPATAAYDRGGKFAAYRMLPSLQEYLLVDLDAFSCEVYRKGADGLWVLHPFARGETMTLASAGLELPTSEVFADLETGAP